jgi:hypothetical protein
MSIQTYAVLDNLPAPLAAGALFQSFTDVTGDVWVAQGGVYGGAWKRARDVLKARAYPNANVAITTAGWVVIGLTNISFDSYGLMSLSNNRFICPIPGIYRVHGTVGYTAVVARYIASLYKNGVEMGRGNDLYNSTAQIISLVVSDMMVCAAGDFIQLYGYASGATSTYYGGGTASLTFLSVAYDGTG